MASHSHSKSRTSTDAGKPSPSRLQSHDGTKGRKNSDSLKRMKRANTFHNDHQPDHHESNVPDAFETSEHNDNEEPADNTRASIELDEPPIELITLTDSFVESLSAKVHSTPPSIDKLSQLFQDFYALASSHVNTHVNTLALRSNREASPSSSLSSISSAASRFRSKTASLGAKDKPKPEFERQMITSEELANRRKARKALEAKKGLLEEAVERRLCEAIYGRIYRHRSTQDEAQDDKLRSKTAALSLVNIGLSDLGVDLGQDSKSEEEEIRVDEEDIRESLESARQELKEMSESHYPLGKINHLKAVHKSIVDTLAHYQPSASADEIMPMLIYTLITLAPENLHVISDLHFVQYFRWEPKLTGEAAYCLTNLEAAISFLQTVDLSTLRADERPSGPPKIVTPGESPKQGTFPPAYPQGVSTTAQSTSDATAENATASKPAASPSGLKAASVLRNRRLSDLVNTPAQAFSTASDAVFSTADQGIKTISNSLGESYSFLLGKLRERQAGPKEAILVPRTLDDARKLISTPPPEEDDNASVTDSTLAPEDGDSHKPAQRDDRVLTLIGGRREHSADSTRSGSPSTKKVGFAEDSKAAGAATAATHQGAAMLDSVRSIGSTFNPMTRLPNVGMFRGFGRTAATPTTTTTPSSSTAPPPQPKDANKSEDGGELTSAFPELAAVLPPKDIPKIEPPNKRFMEIQTPGELRLGEVLDLLRDYRRLAGALKSMGAFEEK